MTQDPEDALAQEAVEGRKRILHRKANERTVVPFPVEVPFGEDPIAPDAQHLGG